MITLYIFILGLLIGSFLNVCIYRIPKEESIVSKPSHCYNCGTRLKVLDLIPVFSYLLLKGKCRYCNIGFSARYMFVEILSAISFLSIFLKYGISIEFFAFAFLISILIVVFFIDLDHMIIPNGLVITALIGGGLLFTYNIYRPFEIFADRSPVNPILGMIVGSGTLLLIAILGSIIYKTEDAMGMGDVKIFAPIGIFLGWRMTIVALFVSVVLGGIVSIGLIIKNKKSKKEHIPFGPFIVVGTFITIMFGWDILNWYISLL